MRRKGSDWIRHESKRNGGEKTRVEKDMRCTEKQ
nr:MAG TPA: hypothetical protein [Caudoviricetes sp.]